MKRWIVAALISSTFAAGAAADEKHKQLGAHEHGHGNFNMAIEGNKVTMELEAPGADIVGFEHKAKTKAQKAKVRDAKKMLKKIGNVVGLPEAAGCKVQKASVELHVEGGDDHGHSHDHKKKAKHDHGHDHKKKQKHGHDDHTDESSHSEFHAAYALTCKSPGKLVELTFPYFKNFKGAQALEVNVVGDKGQKQYQVKNDGSAKISLGGVI